MTEPTIVTVKGPPTNLVPFELPLHEAKCSRCGHPRHVLEHEGKPTSSPGVCSNYKHDERREDGTPVFVCPEPIADLLAEKSAAFPPPMPTDPPGPPPVGFLGLYACSECAGFIRATLPGATLPPCGIAPGMSCEWHLGQQATSYFLLEAGPETHHAIATRSMVVQGEGEGGAPDPRLPSPGAVFGQSRYLPRVADRPSLCEVATRLYAGHLAGGGARDAFTLEAIVRQARSLVASTEQE